MIILSIYANLSTSTNNIIRNIKIVEINNNLDEEEGILDTRSANILNIEGFVKVYHKSILRRISLYIHVIVDIIGY